MRFDPESRTNASSVSNETGFTAPALNNALHCCSKMGDYARAHNMRHRAHGKMHKSVDVLRLQQELGGAIGVCCQKVSEAEVFARAGIKDVLVSNQVRDPTKIDRLARLPRYGARIVVCVDDLANVAELSAAAQKHGTTLECFVEIDCGAGRCGVSTAAEVAAIAKAIDAAPGLKFTGIQAIRAQCSTLRDTRTEGSSSTLRSLRSRKRSKV